MSSEPSPSTETKVETSEKPEETVSEIVSSASSSSSNSSVSTAVVLVDRKEQKQEVPEEDEENQDCKGCETCSSHKFVSQMPLWHFLSNDKPLQFTRLSEEFPVIQVDGFLSEEDCAEIIAYAKDKLQRSPTVIHDELSYNDKNRTSSTAFLTVNGQTSPIPVLEKVQKLVSALSWYPITYIEAINATHYAEGQKFGPHHDFFADSKRQKGRAGDRVVTFFIYLNDVAEEDGGATSFINLGIKVQPKAGRCVFWPNVDATGTIFYGKNSWHEGETVLKGEKWALNVWVRQAPF